MIPALGVETEAIWLSRERNTKGKRQQWCGVEFEDPWRQDLVPFWSEVEVRDGDWLLCFSDLEVEPQYLSLGFYYSCYKL